MLPLMTAITTAIASAAADRSGPADLIETGEMPRRVSPACAAMGR
jgi:hypothetical protein